MLERLTRSQCVLVGVIGALTTSALSALIIGSVAVAFGWYDVSADTPHWPTTSWIMHTAMADSVWLRSAPIVAPEQYSVDQVREGFAQYEDHCLMCHGAPGISREQWVVGLDPTPPYLIDISRHLSPAEIKFIIRHGIKVTAMPAWGLSIPDEKITDLVAFLEQLPNITPATYQRMRIERQLELARNANPKSAPLH